MKHILIDIKQQILVLICCFSFVATFAQYKDLSPNAEFSVLTCGSGDDLYALFGHTALRIKDQENNIDLVFNYGMFDFDTPNFYTKFVKGDLQYHLAVDQFYEFINYYSYKNRTVTEQKINLNVDEKNDIWNVIWSQLYSDERFYQYKFIDNNCTTKVVDLINDHTRYKLQTDFESNNFTYREILNSYLKAQYLPQLGINLIFGKKVDAQNQILFIPEQFLEGISLTKDLESSKKVLYQSTKDRTNLFQIGKWIFFAILIAVAYLSSKKWVRKIYFVIISLLGLLILGLQLYSEHMELLKNPMALFYNPLYLLTLFSFKRNKQLFTFLNIVSVISLFFLSIETLYILTPLLILHLVFIVQEQKKIKE